MSLVAYDASSDEDSDYENNTVPKEIVIKNIPVANVPQSAQSKDVVPNGYISDEDDIIPHVDDNDVDCSGKSLSQLLPKPKGDIFEDIGKPSFSVLPLPRAVENSDIIEENDDEFLHKKPTEEIAEKWDKNTDAKKKPVKITIPSLKNFKDVEKEMSDKAKNKSIANHKTSTVSSGLLSILPKAKSERDFSILPNNSHSNDKMSIATNSVKPTISFVPDTVKHRRPATNTEDVDRLKPTKKNLRNHTAKSSLQCKKNVNSDDSDDDNMDDGDFFSFKSDQSLPSVSTTEINALVEKKAAKIAKSTQHFLKAEQIQKCSDVQEMHIAEQESELCRKRLQEQQLDSEALQVLVGGSTKRRRQQESNIHVIDLNSSQVLPSKNEWMRTALASSTAYQPTGVLVDEEPASGTRRKHQITYLAHKAKANEAELQAMWAANRQNRRATQSKYGF